MKQIKMPYDSIFYVIKENDCLQSLSEKFGLLSCVIEKFNPDLQIEKGNILCVPTNDVIVHIVMPNETYQDIAKIYSVNEKNLESYNNSKALHTGVKILVPNF